MSSDQDTLSQCQHRVTTRTFLVLPGENTKRQSCGWQENIHVCIYLWSILSTHGIYAHAQAVLSGDKTYSLQCRDQWQTDRHTARDTAWHLPYTVSDGLRNIWGPTNHISKWNYMAILEQVTFVQTSYQAFPTCIMLDLTKHLPDHWRLQTFVICSLPSEYDMLHINPLKSKLV